MCKGGAGPKITQARQAARALVLGHTGGEPPPPAHASHPQTRRRAPSQQLSFLLVVRSFPLFCPPPPLPLRTSRLCVNWRTAAAPQTPQNIQPMHKKGRKKSARKTQRQRGEAKAPIHLASRICARTLFAPPLKKQTSLVAKEGGLPTPRHGIRCAASFRSVVVFDTHNHNPGEESGAAGAAALCPTANKSVSEHQQRPSRWCTNKRKANTARARAPPTVCGRGA